MGGEKSRTVEIAAKRAKLCFTRGLRSHRAKEANLSHRAGIGKNPGKGNTKKYGVVTIKEKQKLRKVHSPHTQRK